MSSAANVTLDKIARSGLSAPTLRVPRWALGTVHRRSISFATGHVDDLTKVVWVQSHGMTGDIRIHQDRPELANSHTLQSLDLDTLVALASVEGGVATTAWCDGLMSWSDWIGFQPYDKYPEPGQLRRVGDCMVEFAPSGIYVEDWRFQPSESGLLAGLSLLREVDNKGVERSRRGGLVIAGDHAILSIARRDELPEGTRAQDFVRASKDPAAALRQVFDCTVDYAVRAGGAFEIALSTDPRREGQSLAVASGFSQTGTPGVLQQRISDHPDVQARFWRIDSLETDVEFSLATDAAPDRLAWLAREADTLIQPTVSTNRSVA